MQKSLSSVNRQGRWAHNLREDGVGMEQYSSLFEGAEVNRIQVGQAREEVNN